jgi:exopolysaccharide production protein ExoQ
MPRQLSILVFTLLIVWLWREDAKYRPRFSRDLWIPLIWLLLLGSRPLSWWAWFFFGVGGASSDLDGSWMDRTFYSALIVLSVRVLIRRRFSWQSILRKNRGLVIFYGFLFLTIFWAAYPIPTFKRWVKEIGAIPVLLILLTESNPIEAIKTVFTRCAFVLFSFSVLVIRYIPELGRSYESAGGFAQITGVTPQKNSLGETVMVFGLVVIWQLLDLMEKRPRNFFKAPALQWTITLLMALWLLHECDSKTAIVCFAVGAVLLAATKISFLERRRSAVVWLVLVAPVTFYLLDNVFNISQPILAALGRNPTLTNRTEIWKAVEAHPVNPVLGCGYLNYWDIHRSVQLEGGEVTLKTAHNGYLETYLDGGWCGVFVLAIMLLKVGRAQVSSFVQKQPAGGLCLAFFCMTLLNNISESIFARRGPLWSAFLLTAMGSWMLAEEPCVEPRSYSERQDTGTKGSEAHRVDPVVS